MDLRVSHESIGVEQVVFKGVLEQGVTIEYTLPDYYPNIFKILSTKLDTSILSKRVVANKIIIDGVFNIKVVYISEESGKIKQIENKQAFTKSIDLKESADTASVNVRCKCDYVNTRAQNQRKIDVRGSVSLYVEAYTTTEKTIVSNCEGLQSRKKNIQICDKRINATKDFLVKETMEISNGKPPILDIINYEAMPHITEYKIIANKIIIKGEVILHTLYVCSDTTQKPQVIEHQFEISQIIDMEGVDEDYTCNCVINASNYDIDLQVDDDGECRRFIAEVNLSVDCIAIKNKEINLIEDCYSTMHETKCNTNVIKACKHIKNINEIRMLKHTHDFKENDFESIFEIMTQIGAISVEKEENGISLNLDFTGNVFALDSEQNCVCEKINFMAQTFIECESVNMDIEFNPNLCILSTSYTMVSQTEIEIRVEVKVCGVIFANHEIIGITDVLIDEESDKRKKDNCAIKMYLGDTGENVWDIAKRYNTSVTAILEHNSIDDEKLTKRGMIFIPIVD